MPREQIHEIINRNIREPVKAQLEIEAFLFPLFERDGFCDPLIAIANTNINYGINAYEEAAQVFRDLGFVASAEIILLRWWKQLSWRQFNEKIWIYKAVVALLLTQHYLRMNDKGSALKWALLTHVDDMVGQENEALGRDYLVTVFGVSPSVLNDINQITRMCREEIKSSDNDWSQPQAFPEEIFCRLTISKRASILLGEATESRQFPLSPAYYSSLIRRVKSGTQGDDLEILAIYLLSLLSGCLPRSKVQAQEQSGESDVIVHNLSPKSNINSELFGRQFIAECKNWKEPTVGVPQVGYFLYRMRLMQCKFGIIFTKNKISGKDGRAAESLISKAFHEDGTICINITLKDLESLVSQQESFWWMLLGKIEAKRFGNPKFKED